MYFFKNMKLGIHRYNKNKYIKYTGIFDEKEYPKKMKYPNMMNYNVAEGYVYYCFTINDIEYVMMTDWDAINHSVSAYKKNFNNIRERIGALFYRIEPRNHNIAIKSYAVHNDYAKQGIGGNVLKTILRAEFKYINEPSIEASVVDDRHISYKGVTTSPSALAKELLEYDYQVQGTAYFTYEGEKLTDRRNRMEAEGNCCF